MRAVGLSVCAVCNPGRSKMAERKLTREGGCICDAKIGGGIQ